MRVFICQLSCPAQMRRVISELMRVDKQEFVEELHES